MGGLVGASISAFGARCALVSLLVHEACVYSPARRGEGMRHCREARRIFGVPSAWFRISQTDAGVSTGACIVGRAGIAVASRQAGAGSSGAGILSWTLAHPFRV